mgnify:CR=1 FL=1
MAQRIKTVPLTPEQLQLERDVKRLNERINEIAKFFGTDSYSYNKYYSAVKMAIPEKYRRTSKHGVIQISRSKEFIQTASSYKTQSSMKRLLGMKTVGQLKKEAAASLKAEGMLKATKALVEKRAQAIDFLSMFIEDHSDMFYLGGKEAKEIIHIKGRKKTYSELLQLARLYQEKNGADWMSGKTIDEEINDLFKGL